MSSDFHLTKLNTPLYKKKKPNIYFSCSKNKIKKKKKNIMQYILEN
jgi:hypothetical protein